MKGESGESAKLETKSVKGWNREYCVNPFEWGTRTQPFIYLTPRPRAGCVFPAFSTNFTPNFQLARSSPPTDLHNILEILYKISFLSLTAVSLARVLAIVAPRSTPDDDDDRWVNFHVDREKPAQKKKRA